MTARERLALQAWRAGYGARTVALIAQLARRRSELDPLDQHQVEQVTDAVEVCAQAGLDHDAIVAVARHNHSAADGHEDWRVRCWSRILAIANERAMAPDHYGLSPCDRPIPPPAALPEDLALIASSEQKGDVRCQ